MTAHLITDWHPLQAKPLPRPHCVAIGMFDGVHQGHRQVLTQALALAGQTDCQPAVLTFANHPQTLLSGQTVPLLTPASEKIARLQAMGFQTIACLPFNSSMRLMTAAELETDLLAQALQAKAVVVGEDFHYGWQRQGNFQTLREAGLRLGFQLAPVPLLSDPATGKIGSRRIRDALLTQNLSQANDWLGYPYCLSGLVVEGFQRGSAQLGTPTANLRLPADKLIPSTGVYAGWAVLADTRYRAVANIGLSPTFEDVPQITVEVHLLDYEGPSFYGSPLAFECHHYLRAERRFDTVAALKSQIASDIQQARQLLSQGV